MYSDGQGVAQNYAEAAKWYRVAANRGLAEAQFNLSFARAAGLLPRLRVNLAAAHG